MMQGQENKETGVMVTPYIRLPRFVSCWLIMVGGCFAASHWVPQHQHVLEAFGYVTGGPLLGYLAVTLPPGTLAAWNANRPPFRRIPVLGKSARRLALALGVTLFISGIVMLVCPV